ncbi:MAG: hypothetical protein DBY16_08570 [Coprobacter sp.]|nr:MAG: hypothetical protein DBY16_08570 [Coprobacter sp.]
MEYNPVYIGRISCIFWLNSSNGIIFINITTIEIIFSILFICGLRYFYRKISIKIIIGESANFLSISFVIKIIRSVWTDSINKDCFYNKYTAKCKDFFHRGDLWN